MSEQEMANTPTPDEEKVKAPAAVRSRLYRWTIYFLVVLALAILLWKIIGERSARQEHDEAMRTLRESTTQTLEARSRDMLTAMGQMIEPAVLHALQTGEYAGLRKRFARLKRETPVERISVADASGQTLVASDPTLEGVPIERELRSLLGELRKPVIDDVGSGRLRMIAPVFEDAYRRGVCVIVVQFAE